MSKGVHKHCSVLNYIRHADEELHELIQDLCIGRMFVPKRGSPGITFLRPDKSLLKEIQKMAAGDNPEEAVEALQALVLLDHISSIKEFDDKRSDIPTYLRQKLPVMSADGKKVVLKNGAEISPDKDFEPRGDRANINVYLLTKALVPPKTEDSDFSNAKVKKSKKEGGADLGYCRADLFKAVLDATKSDREPAMEILVELHRFLGTKPEWKQHQDLVASQCSYDALASLAIVLQPYKTSGVMYLENDVVKSFIDDMNMSDGGKYKANAHLFGLTGDVAEAYDKLVNAMHPSAADITERLTKLSASVGKLNVVQKIRTFLDESKGLVGIPPQRLTLSKNEKFAEAELRVLSAIAFDNNDGDMYILRSLYEKCKLDTPYMCDDPDFIKGSNIGFYYSTVYLIARSDALMYVPGVAVKGVGLDRIFDESNLVSINKSMQASRLTARNGSQEQTNGLVASLRARLKPA